MPNLIDAFDAILPVPCHRPWPRRIVDETIWSGLAERLAAGRGTLLGLWGDVGAVHMALIDAPIGVSVASLACPHGNFPSVGALHPPAIRFERAIHDLFGYEPVDAPDDRPWLDHGRWPVRAPLGDRQPPATESPPYPFLPSAGDGLHQIPVGPVHAGIIEPGHFRFSANGETIVRLEERLGYVHKGIEGLMAGASLDRASRLAARCSGDSTVAYSIAFARAVESALEIDIPARANWLRALMAELERLANHLGDIGAICNDAAFALMLAHCGALRERVLRACHACFGHRMMMDAIAPGGLRADLDVDGRQILTGLVATVRMAFPQLVELYDDTASLQDRTVGAGWLDPALARQFGCGGFVGRASGRAFDTRRDLAYPPYDQLQFETLVLADGDVNARVWLRIKEVEQSLNLIEQILAKLPSADGMADLGPDRLGAGEGLAVVEGFRGDILVWVRLAEGGIVERCHLRDPSWLQWPLLEAAVKGNIVADFPLCNKSFNCSYSGHDL
jgi:Ni,Fe-hydrogenase III large subunit